MVNLKVNVGGVDLLNPIMPASGTFSTEFSKVIQSGAQELDIGDRMVTAALKATLEKMSRPIQK